MALVRVKDKYQVTIPNEVRLRAGVAVGDYLEAKSDRGGVITLTPKSLIDRSIAEGLADMKAGRMHGPYNTAEEAIAAVDKRVAAKKSKR
jgi:AbrB family looped-hinge helix DNA binding protein